MSSPNQMEKKQSLPMNAPGAPEHQPAHPASPEITPPKRPGDGEEIGPARSPEIEPRRTSPDVTPGRETPPEVIPNEPPGISPGDLPSEIPT